MNKLLVRKQKSGTYRNNIKDIESTRNQTARCDIRTFQTIETYKGIIKYKQKD